MPLLDGNNPNATFCVSAYRLLSDKEAETGSDNYYATKREARQEFERLVKGGHFYSVVLWQWVSVVEDWKEFEEWLGANSNA